MDRIRTGGCACSAVRFTAHGEPKFISNCHCRDCRRATGAAFSTWVGFATTAVQWQGNRAIFRSSATVSRGYCAECGTPLSYSGKQWADETHLLIGVFDDDQSLRPSGDGFVEEKLEWVQRIPGS
jgi:hypothetical protein